MTAIPLPRATPPFRGTLRGVTAPTLVGDFGAATRAQTALRAIAERLAAEIDDAPMTAARHVAALGLPLDEQHVATLTDAEAKKLRQTAANRARLDVAKLESLVGDARDAAADARASFERTIDSAIVALPRHVLDRAQATAVAIAADPERHLEQFRAQVASGDRNARIAAMLMPAVGAGSHLYDLARRSFGEDLLAAAKGEHARHEVRRAELAADVISRQFEDVRAIVDAVATDDATLDVRAIDPAALLAMDDVRDRFAEATAAGLLDIADAAAEAS